MRSGPVSAAVRLGADERDLAAEDRRVALVEVRR
jgi:hypothetical protein